MLTDDGGTLPLISLHVAQIVARDVRSHMFALLDGAHDDAGYRDAISDDVRDNARMYCFDCGARLSRMLEDPRSHELLALVCDDDSVTLGDKKRTWREWLDDARIAVE